MKLIRNIYNIKKCHFGCALTIGNFDSVHLGHKKILNKLKEKGKKYKLSTMVMIFEPQPLEFFLGIKAPARISRLRDKIKYFVEYNIDYLLCIKFNYEIASLTAKNFILKILVKKLKIKLLVVGDDFKFGNNKEGDINFLYKYAKKCGFRILIIDALYDHIDRISSTRIRKALFENDFVLAEKLMGHPYRLSGRVVYGSQLGGKIGFPTANILLKCLLIPVSGVYAAYVIDNNKKQYQSVVNIGKRPTVYGVHQRIEVHLIDICVNIYKLHIDIVLCKKLRNECKFLSVKELKKKIIEDIKFAKEFFYKFQNK